MTLLQMFFCFFHQASSLLPSPYQQYFFWCKLLLKCEIGFGGSTPTKAFSFLLFFFFFGPKKQGFWIGFARFKRPALESCQIAARL
jgi:hypothetical protein